ncbi:MAG TPA: efflux RND transporter periplasmic adaptor subunit [Chloroflexota bacterium]|nr:efflux RND transporter periplasmic adaptor subunit [Chloroflexota bacterium]
MTTTTAQNGPITAGISYTGDVTASQQVNLAPKVSGLVVKLMADVGTHVTAGQELAELDHLTQDAALEQAQAQLEVAQANMAKLQAQGRPEAVAQAQAKVAADQAKLQSLQAQGRPEAVGQAQSKVDADTQQIANDQAALQIAQQKLTVLTSPAQQDTFTQAVASAKNNLYSDQVARDAACNGIGNAPAPATGKGSTCSAAQAAVNAGQTALDQANDALAVNVDPNTIGQARNAVAQAQATLDKDSATRAADQQALALTKTPNTQYDIGGQQAVVNQDTSAAQLAAVPNGPNDLQAGQANVDSAQANVDVAKVNQQITQVTAPFDGVVSARLLSEGALATTTVPIFTIVSDTVEVDLPIAQEQLSQVHEGQAAQLTTSALPDKSIDAKIAAISPAADPKSRTFLVKVVPVTQDGTLKPGMSAAVLIQTVQKPSALLIPTDAITTDPNTNAQGVYVVQNGPQGQVAVFKTISLGVSDGKNVEVLGGLNPGDLVIISGQTSLTNNQRVRVASDQGSGASGGSGAQGAAGASGKPQGSAGGKPQASAAASPEASQAAS